MAYKSISDYGLIGDMHSAALVGRDGSIDWCCFPRFDSPSVFAAILDSKKGGRFQIAPTEPYRVEQSYLPNTNVLSTVFKTPSGEATLLDFMPMTEGTRPGICPHEIHRLVRCNRGQVTLTCHFQPRFDYARAETLLQSSPNGVLAQGNGESMTLSTDVPLEVSRHKAKAQFTLREGEEAIFVLGYGRSRVAAAGRHGCDESLRRTKEYWEALADSISYEGLWRKQVIRSFLVLHLLIYNPTGPLIAAPTTSLPEEIGGERNWDYRYSWLRDSAFSLGVLYRLGDGREARRFINWLLYQCKVTSQQTRILYGIDPQSSLKEVTLDHLEGYRGSRPVRIGNGAARQRQMDVFGSVITSLNTFHRYGGYLSKEDWSLVESFAETVCQSWHIRDRSIWEVRGPSQHFVYSKIMCWTALNQAITLAQSLGYEADIECWQGVADTIKAEVLTKGWSQRKQSFVQRYGSDTLDASNLMMPFVGFISPEDPRWQSTLKQTIEELGDGPFMRRYNVKETKDGLSGEEGAFTMLSFWLIGSLIYAGQIRKAREYFEEVLSCANHLGLFAEMIDPKTGEQLGNFPQALSHLGLIHTAKNLSAAIAQQEQRRVTVS